MSELSGVSLYTKNSFQSLNHIQVDKLHKLTAIYKEFEKTIAEVIPAGRSKSIAITNFETGMLWSTQAIAE